MKRSILGIGSAALVAAALTGGVALATVSGSDSTIQGCYGRLVEFRA